MTTPCERAEDISEIKKDVKELLAYKNKMLGAILLGSGLSTSVWVLIVALISKYLPKG